MTGGRELVCDRCGKQMTDYSEVGYDGPFERDDDACHPFMAWLLLCRNCEKGDHDEPV